MGYIKSSRVIKLFTFNSEREASWCSEENGRFGARSLRFQVSHCHHLVPLFWTGRFPMDLFLFIGKMTSWVGLCLASKAAMQHSVTDFWKRGMSHLLTVYLMHALCLALHCTLPRGVVTTMQSLTQWVLVLYCHYVTVHLWGNSLDMSGPRFLYYNEGKGSSRLSLGPLLALQFYESAGRYCDVEIQSLLLLDHFIIN